jgi:mRNA interferase YafQ
MRFVKGSRSYKKDFRREARGENLDAIIEELPLVIAALAADSQLPPKYHDHQLEGEWKDCRECHINPDFLLIYRKPESNVLELARLGSHSELYGK